MPCPTIPSSSSLLVVFSPSLLPPSILFFFSPPHLPWIPLSQAGVQAVALVTRRRLQLGREKRSGWDDISGVHDNKRLPKSLSLLNCPWPLPHIFCEAKKGWKIPVSVLFFPLEAPILKQASAGKDYHHLVKFDSPLPPTKETALLSPFPIDGCVLFISAIPLPLPPPPPPPPVIDVFLL